MRLQNHALIVKSLQPSPILFPFLVLPPFSVTYVTTRSQPETWSKCQKTKQNKKNPPFLLLHCLLHDACTDG